MTDFDVSNFDSIQIGLASADQIRSWSHGEVKKPETINYRTLKPEKDGLFCEKIFGPVKDWECACGKYKRIRFKGIVCERCGVEVTRSKVRRERMGHIELAAPVSHIWYFKGSPSRLGYLLDLTPKDLEKVLYFASYIVTSVKYDEREADKEQLQEELEADIQDLMDERDRYIESVREQGNPENFEEFSDEEPLSEDDIRLEIADLNEEYAERIELRRDAFETFMKINEKDLINNEELYREMRLNYSDYFKGGMGAEAIRDLLAQIDLVKTAEELEYITAEGKGQKRAKAIKRLKVVAAFINSKNNPQDMILDVIPVIPPDLRPMVQLDGGRFATSDLNDLYRRVINRNNRLKRLLDLGAPEIIVNNEKRMLQEAVDALFDNGRRGRPVAGPGNRPLKSLSDMLKGKQGRFRQNLLGKRVDYSGRSVIAIGPELKLHECGLPKAMALELFKPFVMKRLVEKTPAANIKSAKRMIDRMDNSVWDVLSEVIKDHPVLLNRAPTLHRLGIQAFEPVLVEGKAIRLHPLVCTAFNADFDGDQMAVHVPLSTEAQVEARVLMLSANNLLSPANGKPLTIPTQDMIIGLYYLTTPCEGVEGEGRAFANMGEAIRAYECRTGLDIQAWIELRATEDMQVVNQNEQGQFETILVKKGQRFKTTVGRIIFNNILPKEHEYINYVMDKKHVGSLVEDCCNRYSNAAVEPILDGLKSKGYHYATLSGISVSIWDATIPDDKQSILSTADDAVAEIDGMYEMGLMSYEERHKLIIDVWNAANDEVGDAMTKAFKSNNSIYMMANSGARGTLKQIRQLAGMRGLMSDPKGDIIDQPIKANFREGLSVLEYFVSTHGTRKGMADTALRTADSGYLTRRLVDVAQDVIVREDDCQTTEGVDYPLYNNKGELDENLVGRCLLEPVVSADGVSLFEEGHFIASMDELKTIAQHNINFIKVRTVMTCHAKHGICSKCYGWDLATRRPVNVGTAVGIIAAQSIGEPGTQLTMRTFHSGGVAGDDITHGLPRVTELFEARKPKGLAVLAEISGTLQITSDKANHTLTIHNEDGEYREYVVSARVQFMPGVVDGCEVEVGQQLTKGSVDPKKLLELTNANTTLRYIVREVQNVYMSQGVDINDKHIEVIARQMLRKMLVVDGGDTMFLPGQQVDRYEFTHENERVSYHGGQKALGSHVLLGITKAALATDSWLSAASFQETTKILTDAAIEGKVDNLNGLKENVIIGKKIPSGTGLRAYDEIGLTYHGVPLDVNESKSHDKLPESAPQILKTIETQLPKQEYTRTGFVEGQNAQHNGRTISSEIARLYLYDDLGVSQRWTNKFSEAGIEMVGDLIGKSESDLLCIEGIGAKAIEELREGLERYDILFLLDPPQPDDMNQDEIAKLIETIFSPNGDDGMLGGSYTPNYFSSDEEIIGLPSDSNELADNVINETHSSLEEVLRSLSEEHTRKSRDSFED